MDLLLVRILFVLILTVAASVLQPFSLSAPQAGAAGLSFSLLVMLFESRVKRLGLQRLLGASIGTIIGLTASVLTSTVIEHASGGTPTGRFFQLGLLILFGYLGMSVGSAKSDMLNLSAIIGVAGAMAENAKGKQSQHLVLDSSVIIDGRIADIADTGFLTGTLVVPQFVLRELQLVADSADSARRNRGRRGLDIVQRLQKQPKVTVEILEHDYAHIREVDMKLVELGKQFNSKVVTNDFNLNKVAQLHGVEILNVNELANALKPVVLPGETMRVFILKEGKEYNQGVAYLDDGTMVVVDNARKLISKTIDISVTSVLQTTAGKMIFGRFDERSHTVYDKHSGPPVIHKEAASASSGPAA